MTTSSSKEARQQGYLYHSIALAHRAKRCQKHWQEHLQICHSLLLQRIQLLKKNDRVAVLGSGLLLETPAEILSSHFRQIDLVDIVHTKDIRKQISNASNSNQFRFIEIDLNKNFLKDRYDFVISANLLSQLPYVLANKMRMKKKVSTEIENEIQKMTFDLQRRHVQQLQELSPNIFLFSDFEIEIHNDQGTLLEKSFTVDKNLKLKWKTPWHWNLAPIPELSREYSVRLCVGVAEF